MNRYYDEAFSKFVQEIGVLDGSVSTYRTAFLAGAIAANDLQLNRLPVDEPANTNSPDAPTELPIEG